MILLPALLLQCPQCQFWVAVHPSQDPERCAYAQSISFRDAIFHRVMVDEPGFTQEEIMCDVVHPNKLGHRCASRNTDFWSQLLDVLMLVGIRRSSCTDGHHGGLVAGQ